MGTALCKYPAACSMVNSPSANFTSTSTRSARTVVEQSRVQHHLFRIKTDAFVGAGIMVVTAYWIGVHPGEHELKVMTGHPFVDDESPRVFRDGEREVAEVGPGLVYIPHAVVFQPAG